MQKPEDKTIQQFTDYVLRVMDDVAYWRAKAEAAETALFIARKELDEELWRTAGIEESLREAQLEAGRFQQLAIDCRNDLLQVRELLREVIPDYERVTKMNHARASIKQIEWVERAKAVLSPAPIE